jgi:hypothetical protein
MREWWDRGGVLVASIAFSRIQLERRQTSSMSSSAEASWIDARPMQGDL